MSQVPVFRNEKGSAMIMALVASVIMALAAVFAQQQAVETEKNLRHLRLRNLLTLQEGLARTLLGQTSSYDCQIVGGALDFSRCRLKEEVLKSKLNMPIPGCVPRSTASVCGIVVDEDGFQYDPVNQEVHLRMVYNGTDAGFAAIESTTAMSLSFMASGGSRISCTPGRPFLKKIGTDGRPECLEISPNRICPEGTYLKSLDSRFEAECVPVVNIPMSCEIGKYMESYNWAGGAVYNMDCSEKLNPFTRWPRE